MSKTFIILQVFLLLCVWLSLGFNKDQLEISVIYKAESMFNSLKRRFVLTSKQKGTQRFSYKKFFRSARWILLGQNSKIGKVHASLAWNAIAHWRIKLYAGSQVTLLNKYDFVIWSEEKLATYKMDSVLFESFVKQNGHSKNNFWIFESVSLSSRITIVCSHGSFTDRTYFPNT